MERIIECPKCKGKAIIQTYVREGVLQDWFYTCKDCNSIIEDYEVKEEEK
jgi:transcription initiation factor TFIIIB Brf1 subunit/transcription initiation factor TFIIB